MKYVLLACTGILLCVSLAMAQTPAAPAATPVIIVSGESEVRVPPDQATVRIGVVQQAKTAAQAQDLTNTVAKDILAAIVQVGIPANEIKTTGLSLMPTYEQRTQPPKIGGYQASNVVTVHVLDLNKIGPVIDAALRVGANEIQGVQFGLRDDLAPRQQALKQAVTEARKKADAIAEAAGVRIAGALEISEGGVSVMPKTFDTRAFATMAAERSVPTTVSAGDLEIHASVTIRYQITPAR